MDAKAARCRLFRRHPWLTLLLACTVFSSTLGATPPAYQFITDASNTFYIAITSENHGLTALDAVTVSGVGGNTAANGTWPVAPIDANHFSLVGARGNGAYTSGGTWTQAASVFDTLVVTKGEDTDDGSCDTDCSLREALAAAQLDSGAETITFATGVSTVVVASPLQTSAGKVTVLGPARLTIGAGLIRIFDVRDTDITLKNLTLDNGWNGITAVGGILNVSNCRFISNKENPNGGAIRISSGTLNVSHSLFEGNLTNGGGGAIEVGSGSTANIANSTFSSNSP